MRETQVRKKIKEAGGSWATFLKWMYGQTVSGYPDGETNYYEYDVNRFIRYQCDPANEPLEDFD